MGKIILIIYFFLNLHILVVLNISNAYNKNAKRLCDNFMDSFSNQETSNNLDTMKVEGIDINKMKRNNLNFIFFLSTKNKLLTNYSGYNTEGEYICTWDIKDGERKTFAYLGDDIWITSMVLSHDENYIIVATMTKDFLQLKCYYVNEEKLLWEIDDLDYMDYLSFSEDDQEVIAVGNDAVYRIDSKNGNVIKEIETIRDAYPQHGHISTWAFLSKSGRYLVIWQVQPVWSIIDLFRSSANKKISVWDITKEKIIASFELLDGGLQTAAFSNDEKSVFLGSKNEILLWNLEQNKITKRIPGHAIYMLTNHSKKIFAASLKIKDRFDLYVWKYPSGELETVISPFAINFSKTGKMPVNFDKAGKYCAIERGGTLFLYDTANWNVLWRAETDKDIR